MPEPVRAGMRLVYNPNPKVRQAAVERLGVMGFRAVVPHLQRLLLEDEKWFVREKAALALRDLANRHPGANIAKVKGRYPNALAVPELPRNGKYVEVRSLIKALSNDGHQKVRIAAVIALGEIGEKEAVPHLIESLKEDGNGIVRANAVYSLAKLAPKEALEPVKQALKDPDGNVSNAARNVLPYLLQK